MPFAPTGLITLTTDFGAAEPFVGIVKGRILQRLPGARIIDLSHGLPAGRVDLAGFWLAQSWREFPPGSVHLAVVDPGVGTARGIITAVAGGHLLLGPDNGLLPEALRGVEQVEWFAMRADLPGKLGLGPLSRTFHGRDLFAPLAALFAAGDLGPGDFGAPARPSDPNPIPAPVAAAADITGCIVLADHFGNLFTNISAGAFARWRQPVVEAGRWRLPLSGTYGEADAGAPLALVNAYGLVEIAVNGGSAAATLGLAPGDAVRLRDGLPA